MHHEGRFDVCAKVFRSKDLPCDVLSFRNAAAVGKLKERTIDRVRRFLQAHIPMRAAAQ
jgi:hypothetical protein